MLLKISFLILSLLLFSSCKVEDQPIQIVYITDVASKVCTAYQVVKDQGSSAGYRFVKIANDKLEDCQGVIGVDAETFKKAQRYFQDQCQK